jgi:hypothetical protein
MSGDESMLTDLRIIPDNSWPVNGIGGTVLYARGIGTMRLVRHVGDSSTYGEVKEVLFVPGLGVNLISIGCLTKSGFKVSFSGLQAIIKQNKTIILTASRSGETLYRADATRAPPTEVCLAASTTVATLSTWHERFAHINSRAVHRMASGIGVNGMIVAPGGRKLHDSCHGCLLGKMHKQPFTHSNYTATSVGQLVVSDLVGPLQVNSVGGARYYVLFKDVHSKYKVVYFMERKSETADCFLDYAKKIKTQTGSRVQTLRCDGDTVYLNDYLKTALADLQINLQISAPYTPEQNGIAERDHRSTVESARSLLHSQGIPLKLWAECINNVVYALNRSVYTPDVITPYQRWFGVKPDVSRLRVFGSVTYFFIPDASRQKLDAKATKGAYVGECEAYKASRVYVESTGRTHISRHVQVFEREPYWTPPVAEIPPSPSFLPPAIVSPTTSSVTTPIVLLPKGTAKRTILQTSLPTRTSKRGLIPKKLFPFEMDDPFPVHGLMSYCVDLALKSVSLFYEPRSFKDAMDGPDSIHWKKVADDEIFSHAKNNTWTLTPLPSHHVCIPSGWDFKVKTDQFGHLLRRKARFFAKGYRQEKGVDYLESFAPVVRYDSLRLILAIAAVRDLEIVLLDATTAFLNGVVEDEIYIAQPEGYVVVGRESDVCRLNKGIYGICQASRIWNQLLHTALIRFGLSQSTADPCVYHRITSDSYLVIAIWVDDGLVAGHNLAVVDQLISFLNTQFEIKTAAPGLFVGMIITRDRPNKRIHLSISQFIDKLMVTFNMSSSRAVDLPVLKGTPRLSSSSTPASPADVAAMHDIPYRQLVGSIMYAALTVRPDVAFMANQLARHFHNPTMIHWKAAKRVLQYLGSTRYHGLSFGGKGHDNNIVVAYSDADYAGDPDSRRSTTGYIFILNGGAISWCSRRQPIVATSTMQSEYIAASDCSREVVSIRRLMENLGTDQLEPTLIKVDNQCAIGLCSNPLAHKGAKHIEVRYHYIRELVQNKTICVVYVGTKLQLADALTKAVDGDTHEKFLKGIGLVAVPIENSV